MDNKKEKPNFFHIAINALITTVITLTVSVGAQWLSLESVVVTVSPSSELDGKYLTIISVQNLEEETLSNLSLYVDADFDVLEVTSSDEFKYQQQYVEFESISPKANYSAMVWTEQPISKGQIIAESDYKTRLNYSNDGSPFLLQMLRFIIPFSVVTFVAASVQIFVDWKHRIKESQKILERCNELKREAERIDTERQSQKAELEPLKKEVAKTSQECDEQIKKLERESKEMQLYLRTHVTQLRKELTFWRDTVRKMLYTSQNEFQTADKVIDTITSTLKTYTTRKYSDENIDELLYLAQLIADSRELHSEHDSAARKEQ